MVREKLNYIDALAKITEPKNVLVGGEISLSYLADVLCKESSVSGLKPAP